MCFQDVEPKHPTSTSLYIFWRAQGVSFFPLLFQGVLESFVGTALCGVVFCLLAGQPLTILSSTGPVLVFERLLFNFSK